jgi:hypothetical protein
MTVRRVTTRFVDDAYRFRDVPTPPSAARILGKCCAEVLQVQCTQCRDCEMRNNLYRRELRYSGQQTIAAAGVPDASTRPHPP